MLKKILPLALALGFCAVAQADEAEVKKAMEAKLGAKVESVTKSGYLGLYEVYAEGSVFYTDEKMSAIIVGAQLIDGKTMKNVTEDRLKKLVEKITGKQALLETQTDEKLLGGVVIKVRDLVFDGSLKNALHQLKEEMLNSAI